jgi:hypothetical protein
MLDPKPVKFADPRSDVPLVIHMALNWEKTSRWPWQLRTISK